jgi:hypothetical protein
MKPLYCELSVASTTEDIVRVTRDYLAAWSPRDFERLPAGCWPAWVRNENDIESWADRLAMVSAHAALVSDDELQLDRLTNHFLIASVRLRQITNLRCTS